MKELVCRGVVRFNISFHAVLEFLFPVSALNQTLSALLLLFSYYLVTRTVPFYSAAMLLISLSVRYVKCVATLNAPRMYHACEEVCVCVCVAGAQH